MTDAAMLPAAAAAFPVKSEARASPFPYAQQRVATATIVQTTRPAAAAAAAAPHGHASVSSVSAMSFDLDFLDPNSTASAGLSGLPSAHLNRNPLDDLNLLDAQPPLLTMPGDTDTAASAAVGAPLSAAAMVAGAQQFSDASSVSSADGSPLSPNDSANQSFSSTPTSPLTPGSPPISPGQPALAPHAVPHALMPGVMPGQMPQLYGANAATMAAWSMAAAASSLPLPMYPLSAASSPAAALAAAMAAQQQAAARQAFTPQAAAAYAQAAAAAAMKPTAGLSVQLPGARAAAAKPQPAKAASASSSVSPPSSAAAAKARAAKPAPAKSEPALASATKGRRGKGAAAGKPAVTASPSGSDDDAGDDASTPGVPGAPGDDKRSKRERNKMSAMKYRKRRKVYLDGLEGKVNDLNETVTALHTENKLLKEQLDFLKNLLKSNGGEMPDAFATVKFGDTSKPMSHAANQPPALPKIPRPSQHAKPHSTLALFCVLACVLLCVTSPNSLFSVLAPSAPLSSHGGALSPSASTPAFAHAPPSEADAVTHRSRVLLECVCARPPAGAAVNGSPTADATADAAANANHTAFTSDCACADEAAVAGAGIDVEQCDTAVHAAAQPEVAPAAVSVH